MRKWFLSLSSILFLSVVEARSGNVISDSLLWDEIEAYTQKNIKLIDKNEARDLAEATLDSIIEKKELLFKCEDIERMNDVQVGAALKSGSSGKIYHAYVKHKGHTIVKEVKFDYGFNLGDFADEKFLLETLGPLLTPELIGFYLCKKDTPNGVQIVGRLILEKMDGTLGDLLRNEKRPLSSEEQQEISEMIKALHLRWIVHQDLHTENVFYKRESGKIRFRIGDLGAASQYLLDTQGNPVGLSKRVNNFRLQLACGTYEQQVKYDYECLAYDLKNSYGLEIK